MIDKISKKLVEIALILNAKKPGSVSEIWIQGYDLNDEKYKKQKSQIQALILETREQIEQLDDSRRKIYLKEILDSLEYQLKTDEKVDFQYFLRNAFGCEIKRVDEAVARKYEKEIIKIEKNLGKSREELFEERLIPKDSLKKTFLESSNRTKEKILVKKLLLSIEEKIEVETVSKKPWTAYNNHVKPYVSKISLNKDIPFNEIDFQYLASHEGYGGHHLELCNKDILLEKEKRGEYGLIITYSPQTYISEGIADVLYELLEIGNLEDPEIRLGWLYDRLIISLQSITSFLYFEDNLKRSEIEDYLKTFAISKDSIKSLMSFCTDNFWGRYAPVYYSSSKFIKDVYEKSNDKDKLLKDLLTQPTTPDILLGAH